MYTRSYNIQSRKEVQPEPVKKEETPELPEGYSGTVMLREQERKEEQSELKIDLSEDKPPLRQHKPVKFAFTRVPKMQSYEQNENTAPQCEARSDNCDICTDISPCEACKEENIPAERQKACRKPRKADLDKLLIGALILLLMNEKSDDVLTLILGYMLM